jgi:ABC-type lipoprotein release transport system permease subunit
MARNSVQTSFLLKRNLLYFWRTNLAVIFGVAIAVGVLAGALIVGDSVRGSLRDLFLQRLGNTSHVVNAPNFFREQLASDFAATSRFKEGGFASTCPLIVLDGTVTHETSGRRSAGVVVYGIDERFWAFHGREAQSLNDRDAFISPSLAEELSIVDGEGMLLRVSTPTAIPRESLHGRKDDGGRTIRLNLRKSLPASSLGEFSIRPQQTSVRAVFVPLKVLQNDLEQPGKVNTILISAGDAAPKTYALEETLYEKLTLADIGIRVRSLDEQASLSVETESAVITDPLSDVVRSTAAEMNLRVVPVLSYVANNIRTGQSEVPYSIVTAIDDESFAALKRDGVPAPIVLNEWAALDLNAKLNDEVTLDFFVWQPDGSLLTKNEKFQLAGIVPIAGLAADRNLVPEYPGITGSESISDWDPPFPVDLERIRKQDEDYWRQYRTTPKAFVSLAKGQELWGTRFGRLTSVRVVPRTGADLNNTLETFRSNLRKNLRPDQMGFVVFPARAQGLEASRGATDFGEYFLYFSFFLVASALLLAGLFFKLGVEQRLREIGTLQAIGFPASKIRALFVSEGLVLSLLGSVLGLLAAVLYGKLMMIGLGTWWVGATGTKDLGLHVSLTSLVVGGVGGMLAAFLSIVWALRRMVRVSARSLLHGERGEKSLIGKESKSRFYVPIVFLVLGFALLLLALFNLVGQAGGFFGSGSLLLVALLSYQWMRLRSDRRGLIKGNGWLPIFRMGIRNATYRPARSVLSIALIGSAAFIIVAVDAFRRHDGGNTADKKSGSGGYALLGETDLPLIYDPNSPEGREALNLVANPGSDDIAGVTFTRFRLRPGDDASCLNLYQPRNPRILGATQDFVQANRFAFQNSAGTTQEEKANPWLLLNRETQDGAIPIIADANSMTYVLHLKLGEDFLLQTGDGTSIRLRLVGALSDSLFQSELVMSEKNFLKLFPETEGFRFFLIDTGPATGTAAVSGILEDRLSDFGFDAVSTQERLAEFHRVENTYLSTFQMLGGLGLALGTLGLAAILLRNVIERRKELALLRAVGFNARHFAGMVLAENAFLLLSGLVIGTVCALLAIAPVFLERGGQLPLASLGLLLVAVILSGLIASVAATAAVLRSPLLPALRAE